MQVTCDDGSYYLGVWFIGPDEMRPLHERLDYLLTCWRPVPHGPWSVEFRERQYADERVTGSQDRKRWYDTTFPAAMPEADVLAALSLLAGDLGTALGVAPTTLVVQGDGHAMAAALLAQPWAHAT